MPEITVGGASPRNAFTDPQSGLRFYRWGDRDLVSVTSIRRMAGVPFGLHSWSIGKVIDAAIDHAYGTAGRLSVAFDTNTYDAEAALIRSELRGAATAERDRAAALGTAVHDAAAAGLAPEDVDPELRPRLAQYRDWLAASGVEILGAEFQVWNLGLGYAGTIDLLIRQRNGTVRVVDLKTGRGIYSEHALQVTAYSHAEFAGNDGIVNETLSDLLAQAAAPAILHLADDGWEFLVLPPDEQLGAWRAFRGLHAFAMWTHEHGPVETFTAAKRIGAAPVAAAEEPDVTAEEIVTWFDAETAIAVSPASTDWCADFRGHQHAHRQLPTGWVCDICFAAGNADGIMPAAADDQRLTADEFRAMLKAAAIKPSSLVGLTRELFPAVGDWRLLDDTQLGALYLAAVERQVTA